MSLRTILVLLSTISVTSIANAQVSPAAQGPNMWTTVALFGGMFALMYFLMIRPQQKRQKEHVALISAIKKGDVILTSSGIVARVTNTGDTFVQIEIANNTEIRIQKSAVASILPKEAYKGDL